MYNIVKSWAELQITISSGQPKTPTAEAEIALKVEELSHALKNEFEKNEDLINKMEILPNIDPENIQKDHRDAVLDYKWMVREVLVWGEELDRKIDTILPDQPEEEEV